MGGKGTVLGAGGSLLMLLLLAAGSKIQFVAVIMLLLVNF
jgi:hypothetical protein